jgi:hypothetical protein
MMEALFKNPHDAAVFAFNFSSQQYAESQMAKLNKRRIGSGKGLVAMDGALQAGLIHAELKKMPQLHYHCLVARYAPRYRDCPCCGGDKREQAWHESIVALRDWSMSTFSGLSHAIVREAIVMKFYGEKVSMNDVAKRANVPIRSIYDLRSKIINELIKIDDKARAAMNDMLQNKYGLIDQN